MQDTTSQLENSKAEAKLLQKQIRDSKGQASSTRFIEKTPPLSPSTDRQMNSFKSRCEFKCIVVTDAPVTVLVGVEG